MTYDVTNQQSLLNIRSWLSDLDDMTIKEKNIQELKGKKHKDKNVDINKSIDLD